LKTRFCLKAALLIKLFHSRLRNCLNMLWWFGYKLRSWQICYKSMEIKNPSTVFIPYWVF
jgi:hypothetical protein